MNPQDYKTVGDRHRILCAVEEYWKLRPTQTLRKLLEDLPGETDEAMLRAINKEIR